MSGSPTPRHGIYTYFGFRTEYGDALPRHWLVPVVYGNEFQKKLFVRAGALLSGRGTINKAIATTAVASGARYRPAVADGMVGEFVCPNDAIESLVERITRAISLSLNEIGFNPCNPVPVTALRYGQALAGKSRLQLFGAAAEGGVDRAGFIRGSLLLAIRAGTDSDIASSLCGTEPFHLCPDMVIGAAISSGRVGRIALVSELLGREAVIGNFLSAVRLCVRLQQPSEFALEAMKYCGAYDGLRMVLIAELASIDAWSLVHERLERLTLDEVLAERSASYAEDLLQGLRAAAKSGVRDAWTAILSKLVKFVCSIRECNPHHEFLCYLNEVSGVRSLIADLKYAARLPDFRQWLAETKEVMAPAAIDLKTRLAIAQELTSHGRDVKAEIVFEPDFVPSFPATACRSLMRHYLNTENFAAMERLARARPDSLDFSDEPAMNLDVKDPLGTARGILTTNVDGRAAILRAFFDLGGVAPQSLRYQSDEVFRADIAASNTDPMAIERSLIAVCSGQVKPAVVASVCSKKADLLRLAKVYPYFLDMLPFLQSSLRSYAVDMTVDA